MRKFWWVMGLCVLTLVLSLPAVAQDEGIAGATTWTCPEGFEGQTLNIYNWSLYIGENTVPDFEKLCGVKVNYDIYVSNEELFARIREGNPGYDLAVPTGYMVENMILDDLLVPLDMDSIPNFANVATDLTNPVYDPGNVYSVPYQWGTVGIAYHAGRVGEAPESWEDMWNYDGPVAWLEDLRAMLGVGLLMLGYDPNTDNVDEIKAAQQYLVDHGENVVAIVNANSQEMLETATVDMAVDYPGNTFQLQAKCECDDYQYVVPKEGSNAWMDNVVVLKDGPNPALAMVFVDYILDPQVGADISNYVVYGSPNQVALDKGLILPEVMANPAIYPPAEVREKLFFVKNNPDTEQAWLDAWDEIKIMLGQ